jgi:RNA polymerase sigma factor for flagellar operon FliA
MEDEVTQQQNTARAAKLVHAHLGFASRLAKQFYWERSQCGIELEDIEGAAYLGLCDAAKRFDAEKGSGFRTYAYFRVRGAMFDSLRRGGGISRTYFNELSRNSTSVGDADAESPANADEQESAERSLPYAFARSISDLCSLVEILKQAGVELHISTEGQFGGLSYARDIDPEKASQFHRTSEYLRKIVQQLPERERKVIELRYFEDENYNYIRAQFNNVSKSWVSRVHSRAIDMMREMMERDGMSSDAMRSF